MPHFQVYGRKVLESFRNRSNTGLDLALSETPEYRVTDTIVSLMLVRFPDGVDQRVTAYSSLVFDPRTLQSWLLGLRIRVGTLNILPEGMHNQTTLLELCPRESFYFSLPPYCQRIANSSHGC